MYAPRDTHLQTQPLDRFKRKRFAETAKGKPSSAETAFNKVSYVKKRHKVNRPLQKIRLADTKKRYAFLRLYWFWAGLFIIAFFVYILLMNIG